jgi:hypothetical protein
MIENPCVKCRWHDDVADICGKGEWVDDAVLGKKWKFEYKNFLSIEHCRHYECEGKGFEPKRSFFQMVAELFHT